MKRIDTGERIIQQWQHQTHSIHYVCVNIHNGYVCVARTAYIDMLKY